MRQVRTAEIGKAEKMVRMREKSALAYPGSEQFEEEKQIEKPECKKNLLWR